MLRYDLYLGNQPATGMSSHCRVCRASLRMLTCAVAFLCLLLGALASVASAFDTAYWVWLRDAPLTDSERAELKSQKTSELFWFVGEITFQQGEWRAKGRPSAAPPSTPDLQIVPVIRLSGSDPAAFDSLRADRLLTLARRLLEASGGGSAKSVQIDYDCPDRFLNEYAAFLKSAHRLAPTVSATALAGWYKVAGWAALQAAVEALDVMFYDLQPDPRAIRAENPPPPMIDLKVMGAQMAGWRACKIPWRAGLPTFARETTYSGAGDSRGHIRNFAWDDLCFNRGIETVGKTEKGVTLFQVKRETQLTGTPLNPGEWVAARWPDLAALSDAIAMAKRAGARGVTYFRLPEGTDAGGWSLRQLGSIFSGDIKEPVALSVRKLVDGGVELVNDSREDLPPRLSGGNGGYDRGYALELDAAAPIWREVLEGGFWKVAAHVQPDSKPVSVRADLATRITFWFSGLRAGEALKTGLIRLAPDASLSDIRWRVHTSESDGEWQKIE